MLNHPVLVLNQNYEPLNICHARRAVTLLYQGKAEMLEDGMGMIHTINLSMPLPSVIRLYDHIKRPRPRQRLSRLEIFNRDHFTCQYCGKKGVTLTLDHIIPRHQGGQHTWENLISACDTCNRRKAGMTPEQSGMKLLKKPGLPEFRPYGFIPLRGQRLPMWQKYLNN